MFKLIAEIREDIKQQTQLTETVAQAFGDHASYLYEGADHYIGRAIGALNSGKDPFAGETPLVDPHVIAALILLSDPDNREAFNFTPAKFAVLDTVDKSEKVRKFLTQKIAPTRSGMAKHQQLIKLASENPRAAARELQKVQTVYSQAAAQRHSAMTQAAI